MKRYLYVCILFFIFSIEIQSFESEKSLVVVVCMFNNIKWVKNNFDSIFLQNYTNFRVICVDDGSTDGTAEWIKDYIKENKLEKKIVFIQNFNRKRKLANLYKAIHLCKDHEIVIQIDGDDRLAHHNVFSFINKKYQDSNVWMTYGQYINEPISEALRWGFSEKGYCRPVAHGLKKRRLYRTGKFVFMHLRTFYAWLFKLIKLEDLITESVKGFVGDFYPASNDLATLYPIVEMAHDHVLFVDQVLYIRNLYSNIVGFKVDKKLQGHCAREIRSKAKYFSRKKLILNRLDLRQKGPDLFLFCNDMLHIDELLLNIKKNIIGLGKIYLFYDNQSVSNEDCLLVKNNFSEVEFVPYEFQSQQKSKQLQQILVSLLNVGIRQHVIFMDDTIKCTDKIFIKNAVHWLEKTIAYGFYFSRNMQKNQRSIPLHVELDDDICAWKFKFGSGLWKEVYSLDMVLYRKYDIKKKLERMEFDTFSSFKQQLKLLSVNTKKVGLCYYHPKTEKCIPYVCSIYSRT